jgi:hypothetical protein
MYAERSTLREESVSFHSLDTSMVLARDEDISYKSPKTRYQQTYTSKYKKVM